jgi:serine/threonine-protein kinase
MRSFYRVPPQIEASAASSKAPWPAPDWNVFFAAAGLDQARFKPVEPEWTPSVMADARAAWLGNYPEAPGIPVRVEAASFHGRPVSYTEILSPNAAAPAPASTSDSSIGDLVYLTLQLVVLFGSVPFARYNLKLGRGDTRGAIRLGLFTLCVCLGSWLFGGTHVAGWSEADLFFLSAMRAVFGGVVLALTYISFEPFVRRRWPQTLIGWSRVLAGGFRDPLVGRDVLLGCAIGIGLDLIYSLGSLLYRILGANPTNVVTDLVTLGGVRYVAGQLLFLVDDTLNKSLGILFLIFLARTLLRREWLAAGVVVLALASMSAFSEPNPWIGWPINILFFGLMVLTLMRFGLLALVVTMFVALFLNQFPLTTDFSAWYAGEAAFTLILTVSLAIFGFRTTLAGQPLFKTE